jgi:SMI1 / KNR4 family (SUKH-1)
MRSELKDYLSSNAPKICEIEKPPFFCEFWNLDDIERFNLEYEVLEYAPGYFGFATSGGGEMFAFDPAGQVVCLPFIGMEPTYALVIAKTWEDFVSLLRFAEKK